MAAIDPATTFFATLNFQPGTTPREAKRLIVGLRRWATRAYPGCGAIYSLEFKNVSDVHYHLLFFFSNLSPAAASAANEALKAKWKKSSSLPQGIHSDHVADPARAVWYLTKCDKQRNVPQCFEAEMPHFWGKFGIIPEEKKESILLPGSNQQLAREIIAQTIAKQQSERAPGYSASVAASTATISVYLSAGEVEELMQELAKLSRASADSLETDSAGSATRSSNESPESPAPSSTSTQGGKAA